MGGIIYLIQDNDQLIEMAEQEYDSEDLLQRLLSQYPSLLAGDQISSTSPRRWLLVKREVGVPFEEGGADRWSVDHLFLDQDGIPTLVEVKRSTDSRLRREVVGQMLDYAANAVVFWPVERIRSQFEATCQSQGQDVEEILMEFLSSETDEPEGDPEKFWESVKTNLQAGKVRMIFVADKIPVELQRVVEFLNSQMDPAEVLALEVKQYLGQGLKTLVPTVIGQTAAAEKKKAGGLQKPIGGKLTPLGSRIGSKAAKVNDAVIQIYLKEGRLPDGKNLEEQTGISWAGSHLAYLKRKFAPQGGLENYIKNLPQEPQEQK